MNARDASQAEPADVRALDLTGRERQLRSAAVAMDRIAAAFVRSARRSLPFLTRHRARIIAMPVALLPPIPPDDAPCFTVTIRGPTGAPLGAVTLDTNAIAVTVEGSLGGAVVGSSGSTPSSELTLAQRALLVRIGRSLARDLIAAIRTEVGLEMTVGTGEPSRGPHDSCTGESLFVTCEIDGLSIPASITLQASAEVLETAAREQDADLPTQIDPRIAASIQDVPVEVVAELGRVSLGFRSVIHLRPGDVIRLPTATDDPVRVFAAGVYKFDGLPVTSRGQLAIEIRSRCED